VTFNPAVFFLKPTSADVYEQLLGSKGPNDSVTKDGVVAVHYRARPLRDAKNRIINPSYSGLAVFTPEMKLIHRHNDPVIIPDDDEDHYDHLGVEDGRLHCFDGTYYYLYCGVSNLAKPDSCWPIRAQLCLARSGNLLHWEKLGPVKGNVNSDRHSNKDGVFFPEKIDGHYFMLHRPCSGDNYSQYAMALAISETIDGPWNDLGIIKYGKQDPGTAKHGWVGASAVPIALGKKRYLVFYHRGHFLNSGQKWYDQHAAIYNFNRFDPASPSRIIEKCLERILVPETVYEKQTVATDGAANVVFTCGCYEYKDFIYMIYGGADCCTLAARVKKEILLSALENSKEIDIKKAV
jgi:predicted GH43/DUF377 family glycosyl hydrolase